MPPMRVACRCVTWNVDQHDPNVHDPRLLAGLLLGTGEERVEILAIGLQEVEMSAESLVKSIGSTVLETEKGKAWRVTLEVRPRVGSFEARRLRFTPARRGPSATRPHPSEVPLPRRAPQATLNAYGYLQIVASQVGGLFMGVYACNTVARCGRAAAPAEAGKHRAGVWQERRATAAPKQD